MAAAIVYYSILSTPHEGRDPLGYQAYFVGSFTSREKA